MKTKTKILAALAVAVITVIGFTGCPKPTDAPLDLIEPGWMCSSQGNFEISWAESDVAIGTVEFTYQESGDNWGSPSGVVQFGICSDTSWTTKYTGANITDGADFVDCTLGANDNNRATGLVDGTTYLVTVKGTADTVSVKIAAK